MSQVILPCIRSFLPTALLRDHNTEVKSIVTVGCIGTMLLIHSALAVTLNLADETIWSLQGGVCFCSVLWYLTSLYILRRRASYKLPFAMLVIWSNFVLISELFLQHPISGTCHIHPWLVFIPVGVTFVAGTSVGLLSLFTILCEHLFIVPALRVFSSTPQLSEKCLASVITTPGFFLKYPQMATTQLCVMFVVVSAIGILFEHTLGQMQQRLRVALSEQQAAIARLQDATRAKTDFLADMSHELRTPIHGILALAGQLAERHGLDHNDREDIRTIAVCADHLLSLASDVLDISRIESGKLELERIGFNVPSEIKKVVGMLQATAQQKRVRLALAMNPCIDYPTRSGDPLRFRQILFNLISNAIKFTPALGQVTVSACAAVVGSEAPASTLHVQVADTGIGISPSAKDKLFQSYAQADPSIGRLYGGTGLGLAISKRLVEAMGGRIGCESEEGHGSTFWFDVMLPVADESNTNIRSGMIQSEGDIPDGAPGAELGSNTASDPTPEAASRPHAAPRTKFSRAEKADIQFTGRRILLADDNTVNQRVAAKMLESLGCQITVASDGLEALERFREGPTFDAVLMDVQMPIMGGFEATKRIREVEYARGSRRRVPVLGLSASVTDEWRKSAAEAEMDQFLTKPLHKHELRAALALVVPPKSETEDGVYLD